MLDVQQKYADKIITKFWLKKNFLQKRLYTKEINLASSTLVRKSECYTLYCLFRVPTNCVEIWRCQSPSLWCCFEGTIDESKAGLSGIFKLGRKCAGGWFFVLTTFSTSLNDSDSDKRQRTRQNPHRTSPKIYAGKRRWVCTFGRLGKTKLSKTQCDYYQLREQQNQNRKTDSETEKLLNNLEAADNPDPCHFTVDRLTEGWDVLNLFDIVRLYEGAKRRRFK